MFIVKLGIKAVPKEFPREKNLFPTVPRVAKFSGELATLVLDS